MRLKLNKIAEITGAFLTGNADAEITGLAKIDEAKPEELTFLYLPAYEKFFPDTKATAIFVKPGFHKSRNDITYLEVQDPNKAFFQILITFFSPEFPLAGIAQSAVIGEGAVIAPDAAIGENVVIGKNVTVGNKSKIFANTVIMDNVQIGSGCTIFPNVTVREECVLGNRVILQPGVVIGSDGFGFVPGPDGKYIKIPQIGIVVLEDDVELGANTCIDRAAMGKTIIKSGTKLDNLVQIAHNVVVGSDTVISAQTGVSGSTRIGNKCVIAGQVGVAGHIEINDNIVVAAQTGVSKSLHKPGMYFGYPAKEHKTALRLEAHYRSLPDYAERIKQLEQKLAALQAKLEQLPD